MAIKTISQVARFYNISTRTLRYYEQIGLLTSNRCDDYAYRVYDQNAITRLQQILLLRKLRIPLKQISALLKNDDIVNAITVFEASIAEINTEVHALLTIRSVLENLIHRINEAQQQQIHYALLNDETLFEVLDTLAVHHSEKKEVASMEELSQSSEILNKLKNIRTVFLPPMTVAASHYFGKNPEEHADVPLHAFVRSSGLADLKPDLRIFGFNSPTAQDEEGNYGYEFWVTVPEDMDIPAPLVKKHFPGGLYGAHTIQMGNFHEWQQLYEWAIDNDAYAIDVREPLGMEGSLEEHLNVYHYYKHLNPEQAMFAQVDLLIPIKAK